MNKLIVVIFFIFLSLSLTYSQESVLDKPISINAKDKAVKEILDLISKKTHYFFIYNPELVSDKKNISIERINTPVSSIIKELFVNSDIDCKLIGDHIVIYEKKNIPEFITKEDSTKHLTKRIKGVIIDAKTKHGIPFATVGIVNSTRGVISNENGEFMIIIPETYFDSTLFFANIGFKNFTAPISEFDDTGNRIELAEDLVSIQEVIIRNNDPILLINNALRNIENNYSQETYILDAFYREAVLKGNNLLTLSEAVVEILKTPYKTTLATEKIKVDKSRKIINSQQIDTVFLKLKDGLYTGLMLDIIKNPLEFIDKEQMDNYDYQTIDIVSYNEKRAHVIEFTPKENNESALFKGKLFIETKSYALIGAEFEIDLKKDKLSDFVVKRSRKFTVKPITVKYFVKYKETDGRYLLNHVRADLEFKVKRKRDAFSSKYKTFFETAVYNADMERVSDFDKKQILKKNLVFIDNNFSYDEDFWENKNYILPEKSIEDALKQIDVKLEYNK